jgi:predicted RNA methylase
MNSKLLNEAQTAELLGISKTSVKNWERHGYLIKSDGGFFKEEVYSLLAGIQNGDIPRLNRRANKKQAQGTILPPVEFRELFVEVSKINIGIPELMFLITLKQFIQEGLADEISPSILFNFNPENYKTKPAFNHLKNRFEELNDVRDPAFIKAALTILNLNIPRLKPSDTDLAGIIYQALKLRGDRSVSGSFYTPVNISDAMIRSAIEKLKINNLLFIDPCCGTGQFMLSFIAAGGAPENAYGIDADITAAFIAASNIIIECPDLKIKPKVFTCDSLLETPVELPKRFDLLATNPPWGACTSGKRAVLEKSFPEIKSGESFSYFISRSTELTDKGSIISMVLPESITNVRIHEDVRNLILRCGRITEIQRPGKIFKGVYTPVITMEIIREEQSSEPSPDLIFNININTIDSRIIDKIYSAPHSTLKVGADWALGIVTGDNKRFVQDAPAPGLEPIIRGGDINPGIINPPSHYIKFEPARFQQTASEWKYRAEEKLIYRFISRRLIFALDRQKQLTLNSANILLPGPGSFSAELIMKLFNSDIYNYIFMKKFNSVKVLRSHLEELPLPEKLPTAGFIKLEEIFSLTEAEIIHIKNQL